jgi:hypothetical protein
VAESGGLLNRYTFNRVSGVRIPLSPPLLVFLYVTALPTPSRELQVRNAKSISVRPFIHKEADEGRSDSHADRQHGKVWALRGQHFTDTCTIANPEDRMVGLLGLEPRTKAL